MRQTLRLFRPAPNQNIHKNTLWQDPVWGYFETHGKMEFLPGEEYNLTDEEKKAVLWRYRVKEILKKEYWRREYDPHNMKYKEGVVMDPAMYRFYATDMTKLEYFRYTPKSVMLYYGSVFFGMYIILRLWMLDRERQKELIMENKLPYWERQAPWRITTASGNGYMAPEWGSDT